MSENHQRVIIIGAGPAGLTAAYELSKLGINSVILEADHQVGGLSRTVNYKGFRFDIGGHRFFSKVPYINQLWQEMLNEDFSKCSRLSRIHYRGRFFDYPLKPVNALFGLGALEALNVCLSYGRAKLFPYGDDDNFELWVANRFGYRLFDIFFKTYTEKVWGMPCHQISADWASQRIKNLSLKKALVDALFDKKSHNGKLITTLIEEFHYPRFGPGMMWERCEQLLAGQGHPTLRGERVAKIRHRHGRVECVSARRSTGERTEYGGEHFISTMPLRELIFALDPPPPDKVLQAARDLRYRDYLTVVLIVNRENVFPDNWLYIHTPEVKLGRVQNYKNWSPVMVPDPSRTSLGLEYFLWQKDDEWRWPNERLIALGIRECERLGLIQASEVEDGTVVRMKKAYPVYDENYRDSLEIIHQYLESFSNLQTIGRNGLHRYNNQDHSMLTGVYAARNIAGESNDVWTVNTEKEYHEEASAKDVRFGDRLTPTTVVPAASTAPYVSSHEVLETAFAKLDPLALGVAVGLVGSLGLFLATIFLLLAGNPMVPNLSLLSNYYFDYQATWRGAFLGFLEAGLCGFVFGGLIAWLRNWSMKTYAALIQKRLETEESRKLLEKV